MAKLFWKIRGFQEIFFEPNRFLLLAIKHANFVPNKKNNNKKESIYEKYCSCFWGHMQTYLLVRSFS